MTIEELARGSAVSGILKQKFTVAVRELLEYAREFHPR